MGKYDGSNPQMAYCGVGNNFVSVNLNKSYGQQSSKHHYPSHYSGSYGSNRGRTVAGGRGGGGMVVLSRPRSSQKAGPKLSVPPPLNLPSMRKEHERFDSLGTSGMPAGGGISGNGPRPTSSGMGWTKPVTVVLQEKEGWHGNHVNSGVDQSSNIDDGISRGNCGVPVSPSARLCLVGPNISVSASTQGFPPLDKATVLRGEDFPSLKAALPIVSGTEKKHKDGLCQKQKPLARELSNEQRDGSRSSSVIDMRPQLHSGRIAADNGLSENGSEGHGVIGSRLLEQGKKPDDYFPVPLPLVHLNPRSDWADDERDTGQGFTDRGRDHGYSKKEVYWDRAIDMPRAGVLPHRPAHSPLDKWGQHDNETRRTPSSEVSKLDPYGRNRKVPSREGREGNSWRVSSPLRKERIGSHEIASDKNAFGSMSSSGSKEKESKYISSPSRDNARDDIGKRDVGYGNGEKQAWINTTERNVRDHYGNEQYNRYKGDAFYNSSLSKSSSYGGKRFPANDPGLNLGIAKRPLSKNEKPYLEDPFLKDFGATGFDGRNPFASNLVGVIKRKDVHKQTDFLDPVRESFEAELERVQNMQEQERQRIVAEQERALEEARREEEDRLQLAREKEEQQRRIEEEAREAAWRAEQEQLEALQREEEQRIAREEEKHRILMEEERRKQAAKQKLLELEERIAKRQADTCKSGGNISAGADEKNSGMEKERDASKATDVSDWEDAERMVERITTSASSDSSGLNRSFEMTSHPHFSSASEFSDRAKPFNSWRRDVFENGNSSAFTGHETENGNRSPRRDIGGRPFPRKDFYGATPYISSRPYYKLRVPESHMDDFGQPKVLQSLNVSADGDCHGRNTAIESGYHDNLAQNYGDAPRGQHCRGIIYPPNPERFYNNPEVDGLSSFGRSRYSVKQPRVLPPPSVSSMQKTSYRGENVCPGPSTFQENEGQSTHARRSGFGLEGVYDSGRQDDLGQHKILVRQTDNTNNEAQKVEDSQSSLSVSSPPDSPIHLSHDELDVFGDSTVSSVEEGKEAGLSVQGIEPFTVEAGKENVQIASSSISAGEDDEWPIDNKQLQVQEEYDEDEDGYQEEDEVHEEDDGNVDLMQEFNEMHLEDKQSPDMMDNLVLGFNEGVEVSIPNDEFDESSRKEDSAYSISQISVGTVEEKASFDGINSDRKPLQSMDSSFQGSLDNSRIFQETKKPMQDLVIQPTADPKSCEVMDNVDATGSSNGLAEHTLPYSVVTASNSTSGLSGTPNASVPTKDEVPVKLQFGLFSGPTLIPSPVLSLQIGSMPLNLHPEVRVGQSSGQMHTSQRPLFQFGQLRYTSPISQGMLPLAPQSLSFVHPNVSANLSLNQKPGIPFQQSSQDTSVLNLIKTEVSSLLENQSGLPRSWDLSHGNVLKEESSIPARENRENVVTKHGHVGILNIGENTTWSDSSFLSEYQGHQNSVCGDSKPLSSKQSGSDIQTVLTSSQSAPKDKILSGVRGQTYSNRGKKYAFAVKGPRSAFPSSEASRQESTGYQRRARRPRTEFKIKENSDKKQSSRMVSSNQINQVELAEKSSANESSGFSTREGVRKVTLNKSKQRVESEYSTSVLGSYLQINSGNRNGKGLGKESLMRSLNVPHSEESNLKRDIEKDVDPPLESGIVRIFEQPGIEAASDGDDFIEVRSKRQMLNDRREQREKEIKAKSRITKMPRKPLSIPQRSTVSACSHRTASASGEETENVGSDFVTTEGRNLSNNEPATGFVATIVSQPLAPIGTPATKIDAQADIRTHALKSLQTSSLPAASGCGPNLGAGFMFESDHKVLDNVQTSLGLWGNSCTSQQVLTQVQLDDALKPSQVDTCAPFGDHTSPIMDPSMLLKGKSSPAASALNTLFAGEKIQFGAVTSPTVLPSGVRVASHGIGHPGPSRSEIQMSHHVYEAENDCSFFFEKKNSNESCLHLEDCGAEAETAASAVAVAAITNDEIVGKVMSTCTVSASDDRGFGVGCSQQLASQSKAEESLSVSLPADLSVENPPISLWPPLPSPQNSSQMISHIPGGHPSQVPFYEMNPMIGGPIFAFGPHEESSSSQLQPQKSSSPASGPLGTWHQCPSGVDSFYGPATGFTGHFIPRPGGIPGIQGSPHMFVYNHFAPVGQFGLSFMGATYIPSGEQPDWKNKPASSAIGEGDVNNLNMASSQHNSSNMPAQIQHLAPGHGSPLLPMASPLAMFDVSPFQAVPSSFPLQQQAVVLPSGFRHVPPVDKSLASDRFLETQTSASDANLKFPVTTEATFTQLPDELGLVEASSSTIATTSAQHVPKSLSLTEVADTGNTDGQNGGGIKSNCQTTISAVKSPSSQRKNISPSQNYCNSSGYGHQRGSGVSPKNGSGEWSHRRMGFQGRNQSVVGDKYGKVKQIYVAKQTSKGTST
ncbi:TUDOR-SN protein 1 isoform 2 [Hibiscus syriacus]|uniref:TUDOR-SN protein 1 isoform 2 n=1 Tax=Hibiscus syriacus TaxID=106335 RepID=A0A6A2ZVS4_HIBSY|nr:TUDOR-SN protein 1 isoform 2 [Hibiscus syriacus]